MSLRNLASVFLVAPLVCTSVHAQAPTPCDACADPAAATEPVIVTAQRRAEDIATVPLSVTSVSGEELKRDGIVDIGGLTSRTPGFAANTNGIPSLYLRGIGSNDLGAGGDPSVGVYQDGIYLGRSTGSIFDLLDVERVEVIRGPQGVLFGRNSAGGAINVVAARPDAHRFSSLSAQTGTFGEQRYTGVANLPITDALGLRIAANHLERDGFIYNRYSDRHISDANQWAARVGLAYAPTAALDVLLQLSAENKDTDGTSSRSTNQSYLTGTPFDAYYSDLDHGFEKRDLRFANLQVRWRTGDWQLSSVTAYRTIDYNDLVDSTGSGLFTRRLYSGTDEQNRQFSEDLLLQRDSGGMRWTFGAGYYRQNADQLSHLESTSDTVNFAASRQLGFPVTVIPPGRYHEENSWNSGVARSVSAFADVTARLSPRWDLIAGLRYTHDSKDHVVDGFGSNNGFAVVFPNTPAVASSASWTDWTPRAGFALHATERTLLYLQYAEGYKSGGFNSFVANAKFAPEHVDQVELGAKWSSADGILQASAAVFDYRYSDLQVSVIEAGKAVIRNAAGAHGRGLDAEFKARLGASWSTGVSAGWLDTEFTDFATGNAALNYKGNTLTYSPDTQASAFLDNQAGVGAFRVNTSLRYSYSGKQFFDVGNTPTATENAVGLLDASVALTPAADGWWRATLFGRNLADAEYVTSIGGLAKDTLNAPASKRGMPRTVGLRLEVWFD